MVPSERRRSRGPATDATEVHCSVVTTVTTNSSHARVREGSSGSKGDKVVGQSRARRVVFVVHAAKLDVGVPGLLQPVAHLRPNPSVASHLAR